MDILNGLFDKAPQEIKDAAIVQHWAIRRRIRADEQVKLWSEEQQMARFAFKNAEKEFNRAMSRYDVAKNIMNPDPKETLPGSCNSMAPSSGPAMGGLSQ